MTTRATLTGHNATTEYLAEIYEDGTGTLAERPRDSAATWSPPVELTVVAAEVCS